MAQTEKVGVLKPIVIVLVGVALVAVLYYGFGSGGEGPSVASGESSPLSCTSYEYSRWSPCSIEKTQTRIVTAAYPEGCRVSGGVMAEQEQVCVYVPLNLEPKSVFRKIISQIEESPDRDVMATFLTGASGENVAYVNWMMSDDGNLLIYHRVFDRQTEEPVENLLLRDSNRDQLPDLFSRDGTRWYEVSSQAETDRLTLVTTWGLDMALFSSYLLDINSLYEPII